MALDRLTKVDGGGISTTSDYRVGIITATKFVGPIEGDVTGSITATEGTFSGNVTIGGTLTYEDVTNIDSVGLVTARDGIFLPDGKVAKFGNTAASPDLEIFHDGNVSRIRHTNSSNDLVISNTGNRDIYTDSRNLSLRVAYDGSSSPENAIVATGNDSVDLYFNGQKKLETSNTGVTVTGTLAATAVTGDGSGLTGIAVTEAPVTDYTISANGSSAYRIHGGGVDETANNPDLYLIRGQKYRFNNTTGSSHPFQILVSNGGSEYGNGVSGDDEGVQFFTVPYDAPASLVYQCSIHGGMIGNIYIRGAAGNNTNVGLTTFSNDVILDSGDITVSHTGLAVNIFESTNNHSRLRIKSADASLAQLEFADQSDADAGEIRYDHGNDRMTFHVGANNERLRLDQYGYATLDSGSQGSNSKPGIELKSSGYTGNITKLFQDSPNAESYLQTTERPLIIDVDSTNGTSSSRLQVNIDGDEKVRITSDGYILTAQQVGCAVRMSSNFTHPGNANFNQGSNWVMPFDTEVWDIGGNFNTSNYTFTAPVAGRYLCCYTIQLESISNWLWNYVYPVVTGTGGNTNTVASAAAGVVFSDDAGNGVTGNSTTTAQYHTFTNTVVMNLTAGQAVRMGVRGNMTATIKSGAESQWTMQLLG